MTQTKALQTSATTAMQAPEKTKKSILSKIADRFGVDPTVLNTTLKQTCFKIKTGEVTDSQMVALLIVADQYKLNPFTKEIYAYPDKAGGIVPVVSVDGWDRIINGNPQFNGVEFSYSDTIAEIDNKAKPCPEWIDCIMHRKDRDHPIIVREHLDECYRSASGDYSGPWQTHTKRMLRHKALIQCARVAFGFAGIYDEDEGIRITEAQVIDTKHSTKPVVRETRVAAEPEAQGPIETTTETAEKLALDTFLSALHEIATDKGYKTNEAIKGFLLAEFGFKGELDAIPAERRDAVLDLFTGMKAKS